MPTIQASLPPMAVRGRLDAPKAAYMLSALREVRTGPFSWSPWIPPPRSGKRFSAAVLSITDVLDH